MHPKLRTALDDWGAERATWTGAHTNAALFLNRRGGRLSTRSAYDILTTSPRTRTWRSAATATSRLMSCATARPPR